MARRRRARRRHRRREARARDARRRRRRADRDRQHRRRHRDLRRLRQPRPRPRHCSGSPTVIDERGWGLRDDTFAVMDGLRELGADVWFSLGDRDLAIGIERARAARRRRPPDRRARRARRLARRHGARAADERRARPHLGAVPRALDAVSGVHDPRRRRRTRSRTPSCAASRRPGRRPRSCAALAAASAIVIGPSNPVISIGPILSVPEMRQALLDSPAPIVAVSPIVGGAVLKGPTEAFMRWAGHDARDARRSPPATPG